MMGKVAILTLRRESGENALPILGRADRVGQEL